MKITKRNIFGYTKTMDLPITEEQLNEYQFSDKHVQNIFPKLKACEREFLINGTTPKDWEEIFGGCSFDCNPCKYNIKYKEEE